MTVYLGAGGDFPSRMPKLDAVWLKQFAPRLRPTALQALQEVPPGGKVYELVLRLEIAGVVELVTRPL